MTRLAVCSAILAALAAAAAPAGAAKIPESYVLEREQARAPNRNVFVIDARPIEEKARRVDPQPNALSIEFGDRDFSADRVGILTTRLHRALARMERSVQIRISRFASSVSRSGALAPGADWMDVPPSVPASVSTVIQGTVNELPFAGTYNSPAVPAELALAMPRAIDGAMEAAVRDVEVKLGLAPPPLAAADGPKLTASAPPADPKMAAFLGAWEGAWSGRRSFTLAVERISGSNAELVYSWGPRSGKRVEYQPPGSVRVIGEFGPDGRLNFSLKNGARFEYALAADGASLDGRRIENGVGTRGVFRRRPPP